MTLESTRLEKGLNGWESVSVSETFSALSLIHENLGDGRRTVKGFHPSHLVVLITASGLQGEKPLVHGIM